MNSYLSDVFEMTKPRLCLLALMMAALGFYLGSEGPLDLLIFLFTLTALALIGASCGILNQYLEKDIDALMWRTMDRPLPSGRISERDALMLGFATGIIGEFILLFAVNSVTAVLGAFTLFFYLAVYTPSKRVSSLSTLIGTIPGALPPLMGWTAAQGRIGPEGLLLFLILVLWQVPHFLAIAWIYREDYARAKLPILSVVDPLGINTSKQILLYCAALIPLTLVPSLWGVTGHIYFFGAIALGLIFLINGFSLVIHRSEPYARRLFLTSILYLPALGLLMVWDRTL